MEEEADYKEWRERLAAEESLEMRLTLTSRFKMNTVLMTGHSFLLPLESRGIMI